MSFDRPLLLLTLLVLPLAGGLYLLVRRRRVRYAVVYTNVDVLAALGRTPSWRRHLGTALFALALAALCVGVARPRAATTVPDERATVVLVIDASRSMESQDVRPSRLAAARTAAKIFLERIPARLRVGLVVFAGEPTVAAPPTVDHDLVRRSIDLIDTSQGFGGTAIGDAIARAVELGRQTVVGQRALTRAAAPATKGLVSILFLSDGRQNRGILPPLAGAARAKAAGIPVYTIALGTESGGRFGGGSGGGNGNFGGRFLSPDPETLKAIARSTGGTFAAARSASSVNAAYARLGSRLGRKRGTREITFALVAAGAALLAAAGAVAAVRAPRLP